MEFDRNILSRGKKKRQIIYRIMEHPGIYNKPLSELLGISQTALVNQLKKLEEANLIIAKKRGQCTCWYVNQAFAPYVRKLKESEDGSSSLNNNTKYEENSLLIQVDMQISFIKNILANNASASAQFILDNWDVFIHWFSISELMILLYELGICVDTETQASFDNKIRENLLTRYKDILYYVTTHEENLNRRER